MLKPGGRVFSISITPYVKRFEKIIPIFEDRKKKNDQFPGYVENLALYLNESATSQSQQQTISKNPFLFLDCDTLIREFETEGFKIIECRMTDLGYYSPSWSLDGRENIILIAEKPISAHL